MKLSLIHLQDEGCWEGAIVDQHGTVIGDVHRDTYEGMKHWALDQGVALIDLPAMMQVTPWLPLPERKVPRHMEQCRYLATYHGSMAEHHGEHFVTIDWDSTNRYGDTRYIVYLDGGQWLPKVRASSLTIA